MDRWDETVSGRWQSTGLNVVAAFCYLVGRRRKVCKEPPFNVDVL